MPPFVKLRVPIHDQRLELERLTQPRTEKARLMVGAEIVLELAGGRQSYKVTDQVGTSVAGRPRVGGTR
jgi:hypothetical protein